MKVAAMTPQSEIVFFDEKIRAGLVLPASQAALLLFEEYQSTDRKDSFVLALIGRLLLDEARKP
jgi:hypothetical protein